MYKSLLEERRANAAKKQKQQLGKLKRDLQSEASEDGESCFALSSSDAGAGLSLRLDNEDDSSTDDEEANVQGTII